MREIQWGNVVSSDYNCYIFDLNVFQGSPRQYTMIDIPARSGQLVMDDKRYPNAEHSYVCAIPSNFKQNFADFKTALLAQSGYQRLYDSDFPDEFYQAILIEDIVIDRISADREVGVFTIVFSRKPQRYLIEGEAGITLTANGSIINPTGCDAKPLIRINGSGTVTVAVGNSSIKVTGLSEYIDIDCENMEAYKGSQSMNGSVEITGGYPVLGSGSTGINKGSATSVVIYPRWWRF